MSGGLPELSLANRQRKVKFDMRWLRRAVGLALPRCTVVSDDGNFALRELGEVDIAVVSDATIAQVHVDFMDIEGATDVITFEHGEIVVSAETAAARAGEFAHTIEEELLLYCVHGLLHLNGFDDLEEEPAGRMSRTQAEIHREVLEAVSSS